MFQTGKWVARAVTAIAVLGMVAMADPAVAASGGIVSDKAKDLGQDFLTDTYTLVRIGFAIALLAAAGLGAWKKWDGKWIVSLFAAALAVAAGPEIMDRLVPKDFGWKL